MKIQLANRTYHQTNNCCFFCVFRYDTIIAQCSLNLNCNRAFKKKLFNDKIFKL